MTDKELDDIVLRVVGSQSPGYLIHPTATAFVVEGLSPDDVEASLARLEGAGHVTLTEEIALQHVMKEEEQVEYSEPEGILRRQKKRVTKVLVPVRDPDTGDFLVEPMLDKNGDPVVVNEGWEITEAGQSHADRLKEAGA